MIRPRERAPCLLYGTYAVVTTSESLEQEQELSRLVQRSYKRNANAATFLGVRTAYNPEVHPKDRGQHEGGIPIGSLPSEHSTATATL